MAESGLTKSLLFTVTAEDTAIALGSGSLPVLATPRLVAWLEAATCAVIDELLDPGSTSVGTQIHIDHLRPTPVGKSIEVGARLIKQDGRRCEFEVSAVSADAELVATGTIVRVTVDAIEFERRAKSGSR
ncbi:MAG: thioesterase family protein [Actinomycetes bacterium]